jgi:hypothetical protein
MPPTRQAGRGARHPTAASNHEMLKAVSKEAIGALTKVEGNAPTIKFNKLVYHLHKELAASRDRSLHFDLPFRWYLYGAVVDINPIFGYVVSHNPEEEMSGDFSWHPGRARIAVDEGVMIEIQTLARQFARKYAGPEGVAPMLRDHYVDAPLPFQKAFLEWSLSADDMIRGRTPDSPATASALFERLEADFPGDLEPRLVPMFDRLSLFLEPLIQQRVASNLRELRWQVDCMKEFWQTFCLFLSTRYNHGIPESETARYSARAEAELVAYKRRLSAFLTHEYADPRAASVPEAYENSGRALSEAMHAALSDGGPT